jgi:hypothetical protein
MESIELEKVIDLFESDLIEKDFIKAICNGAPEYEIDHDTDHNGECAWIEFKNVKDAAIEKLNNDYNAFALPFETWAKNKDLMNPEILGGDNNCLLFQIYL